MRRMMGNRTGSLNGPLSWNACLPTPYGVCIICMGREKRERWLKGGKGERKMISVQKARLPPDRIAVETEVAHTTVNKSLTHHV